MSDAEEKREEEKIGGVFPVGEDQSFGPLFAIIIIVVLLLIGAFYVLKKVGPKDFLPRENTLSKDSVVKEYSAQSASDNLADIRRDLSATSIEALNRGLSPVAE